MSSEKENTKLSHAVIDEALTKEIIDELFRKVEEQKETKRRERYCPDVDFPIWLLFVFLFICIIPYLILAITMIYFYFTNTDETVEKFRNDLDKMTKLFKDITGKTGIPIALD